MGRYFELMTKAKEVNDKKSLESMTEFEKSIITLKLDIAQSLAKIADELEKITKATKRR